MPITFQYWTGAAWTTENNKIKSTIMDTLGYPMSAEITIANPNNVRESTYSDYQRVRCVESSINRIIFYGKLERKEPRWDEYYGQVLVLYARDNLQELLKRINNRSYAGFTLRSALISQILGDYSYPNNIGTADAQKLEASVTAEPAGQLDIDFDGSGKNVLRSVAELASEDPWSATDFSGDYYLDAEFSGNNPTPDFNYFQRGNRPSGGASTQGLTVQYGLAAETNQARSMLPDYNFPDEPRELVTRVRIEYVDAGGASQSLEVILISLSNTVGSFTVGETITGGTSGTTAVVQYSQALYITVSAWSGLFTVGETITGGSSGATATVASVPRQTIQQDVELVLRDYYIEQLGEARDKAAQILYSGANTITRGNFGVIRWPYYTITGTHTGANNSATLTDGAVGTFLSYAIRRGDVVDNTTDGSSGTITTIALNIITAALTGGTDNDWDTGDAYRIRVLVRAGHAIRVINSQLSINENMVVTQIVHDEGPGLDHSRIEVLRLGRGQGLSESILERIGREAETALWASIGAMGGIPIGSLTFNTNITFSATDNDTVAWTPGTMQFSDGSTYAIVAGNTGNMAARTYIFLDTAVSSTILQITTTYSSAIGITRALVAVAIPSANTSSEAAIITFGGAGFLLDGADIANDSITNAILQEGAQPYNSNVEFSGAAYNQVQWLAGTIAFGDGSTQAINAGSQAALSDSTTYWVYATVGSAVLTVTSTYSDVFSDSRVLLAIIVVGVAASGSEPTILPFASRVPTLSAVAIAANAIVADAIAANAVTAVKILAGAVTASKLEADLVLTTNIIAGTLGGDRWEITPTGIRGYDGAVLEVELVNSGANAGRISAGAGSVLIDELGITINGLGFLRFSAATFKDATIYQTGGEIVFADTGVGTEVEGVVFSLGANGVVRPSTAGDHNLGTGTTYWDEIFGQTLRIQDIRRRSGLAGGDIGTTTAYFSNLYIGQAYNSITGASGDMELWVANTAGNARVRAVVIEDGDAPFVYTNTISDFGIKKNRTSAPALGDLQLGEFVVGDVGSGATDGRIWYKPNALEIWEFNSVARIT